MEMPALYGRSTHGTICSVRFFDGQGVREFTNEDVAFRYRHSRFKENKQWIILSSEWELTPGDGATLRKQADDIRAVRDAKYPPTMKCAGSIFKNLLFAELPAAVQLDVDPKVVREGKVPSAYFLERVDAKGMKTATSTWPTIMQISSITSAVARQYRYAKWSMS